ncbi:winged helix-turn-helix domain-containing protein [Burkholderia ubonensis]|uniref:winged helix-turn-helix domain-containing protein n=1 Tax=Burkholderia ubonensis TaxID=101571 RepID=UPI0012FC3062|nr:winged helix-turn-helix domain-containing protein [Burkholderia ubonensis]
MEMISLQRIRQPDSVGRRICLMLEKQGNLTQRRLTMEIGVTKGAMSKYLKALCAEGYVVRVRRVAGRTGGWRKGMTIEYARTALPLPPDDAAPVLSMQEVGQAIDAMVRGAR